MTGLETLKSENAKSFLLLCIQEHRNGALSTQALQNLADYAETILRSDQWPWAETAEQHAFGHLYFNGFVPSYS